MSHIQQLIKKWQAMDLEQVRAIHTKTMELLNQDEGTDFGELEDGTEKDQLIYELEIMTSDLFDALEGKE